MTCGSHKGRPTLPAAASLRLTPRQPASSSPARAWPPANHSATAHLTNCPSLVLTQCLSRLGSTLTPVPRCQQSLDGGRGPHAASRGAVGRRAKGRPNGALRILPAPAAVPPPFRATPERWPLGGAREPGLLATPKQGHFRTGL